MFARVYSFILFIFLIAFPFYLMYELPHLDKAYFFCPIEYKQDTIIIRHDSYGSGDFLSKRNGSRRHNGIDLQARVGDAVYAVRKGKVMKSGFHRGMGNYVQMLHPGGLVTVYGHLSQIDVRERRLVRQADKIGEVGKTGNANYRGVVPHLHFEIRKSGRPLDPMDFLE